MKFGASVCPGAIRPLKRCSFEQELNLRHSTSSQKSRCHGDSGDTVVTMPIPADNMIKISFATGRIMSSAQRLDVIRRLYWSPRRDGLNSVILFLGNSTVYKAPAIEINSSRTFALHNRRDLPSDFRVPSFEERRARWVVFLKLDPLVCPILFSNLPLTLLPGHRMVLS
jgi:hypothetical protein